MSMFWTSAAALSDGRPAKFGLPRLSPRELEYFRASVHPAAILEAAGLSPDPWQVDMLGLVFPRVLLNCSRQVGKSTSTAALGVWNLVFNPGSDTLIIAPSLRQAEELFRKVVSHFEALQPPIPVSSQTSRGLSLKNGSRCLCVPGTERASRGFSAPSLVLIDEASRVPDESYQALTPLFAANPKGRLVALSTPNGTGGWFAKAWFDDPDGWQRIEVPASRVPRISAEFLARERRLLGEPFYKQEYECSFDGQTSGKNPLVFGTPATEAMLDQVFQ